MRTTRMRLADGRELFYYDRDGAEPRSTHDSRGIRAVPGHSEVRYDPVRDEWVAMAATRQGRTFQPPADECPLCPSSAGRHTEIPSSDYDVVVFENRFPSFSAANADRPDDWVLPGLVQRRPGTGRCEVVCFTSDHDSSFGALPVDRIRMVVDVWAERTIELSARGDVQQVFCFENRGAEIGVTLAHPHGQIYGYPFVTPRTERMLTVARNYARRTGGHNLYDDVVAAERQAGVRVVRQSAHWTAFVPAAARWPFEVHLYPQRRVPDLPALTSSERADLAAVYSEVLRALDGIYDLPMPYVAAWHQAPVRAGRDIAALHLELFSIRRAPNKLKYLAGSESGMDVFVNDVLPEDAAARLRAALPDRATMAQASEATSRGRSLDPTLARTTQGE